MKKNKLIKLFYAIILPLCLLSTLPLPSQAIIVDRIVAVVNGQIITLSELQELEYSLRGQEGQKPPADNAELSKTLLENLIDKKLQLQLAAKKNITVSAQQIEEALEDIKRQNNLTSDEQLKQVLAKQGMTLDSFARQLKDSIKITILVKREVGSQIEISEEEIQAYYQEHQVDFKHLNKLRAQHILFYLPADAAPEQIQQKKELASKVWQSLQAGEDFSKMAGKYSDDPSAEKGGDLGYFKQGEMLPALEKAALTMKPGEISPVLQTHLGFHILKLTDYQEHNVQNDPKIEAEIKNILFRQKSEKKLEQWLEMLRQQAKIKIMP